MSLSDSEIALGIVIDSVAEVVGRAAIKRAEKAEQELDRCRERMEAAEALVRWLVDEVIRHPKGLCLTVPNGDCLGVGCIHDPLEKSEPEPSEP